MTTFYLRKLYAELGCVHERGKKPTSEVALLEALAKHILGHEFTPGLMKAVALARTSIAEDALQAAAESPLMVGDVSEALDDDIEDMHLENEIKGYQDKVRAKRLREMQRREALYASIFQSAPASAASAQNATRQKKGIDLAPGGFSQRATKRVLPPGAQVSKSKEWDNRWRIQSLCLGIRTRSFRADEPGADNKAFLYLLRLAWAAHTKAHGEECPWQLDVEDGEGSSSREF